MPRASWSARCRLLPRFAGALLLATAWGCFAQTLYNLAALEDVGLTIPLGTQLHTLGFDLLHFGPLYAGIVLAAWLPALALALGITRHRHAWRRWAIPLACGVSILAAIRLIDAFAPMPALIYATRTLEGLLMMGAGGVVAGWFFVWRVQTVRPLASG